MGERCGSGYLALEEFAARSRRLRSDPTLRTAWPAELAGSVQRMAVSVKEPESFFDPLSGSVMMGGKTVLGSGCKETSSMRIPMDAPLGRVFHGKVRAPQPDSAL
jgi:hypothetical protein